MKKLVLLKEKLPSCHLINYFFVSVTCELDAVMNHEFIGLNESCNYDDYDDDDEDED